MREMGPRCGGGVRGFLGELGGDWGFAVGEQALRVKAGA